jgi:hypothetical protein
MARIDSAANARSKTTTWSTDERTVTNDGSDRGASLTFAVWHCR